MSVESDLTSNNPLTDFVPDFVIVSKMRDIVVDDLKSKSADQAKTSTPFISELEDGRKLRIVYPHGPAELAPYLIGPGSQDQETKSKDVWCVGFFGFKLPQDLLDPKVDEGIWMSDDILVKGLPNQRQILCYASLEAVPKGNWVNFVVMRSPAAVEDWKKAPGHEYAARDLSCRYYRRVRIHFAKMIRGFEEDAFEAIRTTFVNYVDYLSKGVVDKQVKSWTCDPNSNIIELPVTAKA